MNKVSNRWIMGSGASVLAIVSGLMWQELHEPGNLGWNLLLAAMLITVCLATFLLHRFFANHIGEIGEARFDTRNSDQRHG